MGDFPGLSNGHDKQRSPGDRPAHRRPQSQPNGTTRHPKSVPERQAQRYPVRPRSPSLANPLLSQEHIVAPGALGGQAQRPATAIPKPRLRDHHSDALLGRNGGGGGHFMGRSRKTRDQLKDQIDQLILWTIIFTGIAVIILSVHGIWTA